MLLEASEYALPAGSLWFSWFEPLSSLTAYEPPDFSCGLLFWRASTTMRAMPHCGLRASARRSLLASDGAKDDSLIQTALYASREPPASWCWWKLKLLVAPASRPTVAPLTSQSRFRNESSRDSPH